MTEKQQLDSLTRRRALTGAAGIGIALPVLAACGGDDEPATGSDPAAGGSSSGGQGSGNGGGSGGQGGSALASTSDIEVGGGAIYPNEEVVVTQPSEGEFKAFSIRCTHQGCAVAEVTDDGIICPCHNSVFSISDGAPQGGPATAPLEERTITVEGDQLVLG